MEYLVAIDGRSPLGAFFLSLRGKIGGATTHMEANSVMHPVIVATDIDWSLLPAFVRMTHIRNPGTDSPQPVELVVPAASLIAVMPKADPASQPHGEQQTPPAPLH